MSTDRGALTGRGHDWGACRRGVMSLGARAQPLATERGPMGVS